MGLIDEVVNNDDAAPENDGEKVEELLNPNNLIDAVVDNNIEKVEELLSQGADPNIYIDSAKVRPLHFAAQAGNIEIGRLLITAGADIHATTEPEDELPIDIARLHDNQGFVQLLATHIKPSETMN